MAERCLLFYNSIIFHSRSSLSLIISIYYRYVCYPYKYLIENCSTYIAVPVVLLENTELTIVCTFLYLKLVNHHQSEHKKYKLYHFISLLL